MNTPWLNRDEDKNYPALNKNIDVDVCVIGGGITGITTAFLLQEKGKQVALLERNKLATGVSGHTSGHLTSLVDAYYHNLISTYSLEKAKKIWDATTEARQLAEKLINNHKLDAGFEKVNAYYYATDDDQLKLLEKEREALEKLAASPQEADPTVMPFAVKDIFSVKDQAVIDAASYVKGLAGVFTERGGQIFEETPVVDFSSKDGQVVVKTKNYQVTANSMVQATHTPLKINPIQLELLNYNSYVITADTVQEVKKGLFYDFAQPYHYTRHYEENGELKLILGGHDNRAGSTTDENKRLEELLEWAHSNFQIKQVDHSWSSMFFSPSDDLPFIGKDPIHSNCYLATGFSGDGLTYGLLSAIINTSLITGEDHPCAELLNPARFNLSSADSLLKKGRETVQHLLIDRLKLDGKELEEISLGQGKILHINDKKVGISVDQQGKIHAIYPICSHMNCVLHWNNLAKTWDCGCHGSRFSPDGKVLSGPATKNLQSSELEVEDLNP